MISEAQFILGGAAASGLLIAAAMRGGRTPGRKWCARCLYSLDGAAVDSLHCPECGSGLGAYEAVACRRRAAQPRLLGLGLAVFALTAITLGVRLVQRFDRINWTAHKPVAWLAFRAGSARTTVAESALKELIRRADSGGVSDADLTELARRGLAHQEDAAAPWQPLWGTLVEEAIGRGLLTEDERRDYLRRCLEYSMALQHPRYSQSFSGGPQTDGEIEARRRSREPLAVAKYDLMDVEFIVSPERFAQGSRLALDVRCLSATIGDWACPDFPVQRASSSVVSSSIFRSPVRARRMFWIPIAVAPGRYEVSLRWEVNVRLEDEPPETAVTEVLELHDAVVVSRPREGSVPIETDAAATEVLRSAFAASALGFRSYQLTQHRKDTVTIVYFRFDCGPHQRLKAEGPLAPFNGSIDVEISSRGEELRRVGADLPAGWVPFIVDDDQLKSVDVRVHYSRTGRSLIVGTGPGFGPPQQIPQPFWMGPPFDIPDVPITWFDTIEEVDLSEDELESIQRVEPF
ncbi:MAG: hypothetical protein IT430_10460 [Phycisphaerales bacterium]|nr:hypothetical protein [Phycisphaerales bacterium]